MPTRFQLANAIRALSMDAVQRAKSGHPGMPMGMADIAEVLWNDFLQHNPLNPTWPNRDRFILSNGHGSMLHYSLLHLTGYDLTLEDLKSFRQLHSKTPGHPEYGYTPGVETTTGPLGQGFANAVGMALAEANLAAHFNRPGHDIIDHNTYVFLGDGCMMEGVSHETASLAGTFELNKLVAFWDDNEISIDGDVAGWFTDDTPARFEAYGWHVVRNVDGHDPAAIKQAISEAQSETGKPTLICCRTVIGFGSPNAAGSHECHGAPLGDEEIKLAKQKLEWPGEAFAIPQEIYTDWDAKQQGEQRQAQWDVAFAAYTTAFPELATEFKRRMSGEFPENWTQVADEYIKQVNEKQADLATRKASQQCINAYAPLLPEMLGGSADLTGSNLTAWDGSEVITRGSLGGNYIHFGVREFGMTAIANGMALYGGFIPYTGTFLVFCDYARNAVRLAALMKQQSILVYTHDSLGLGEDGPTHQPVEHAAMLRLTPNMSVWRPADAVETAVAWRYALEHKTGPTSLLLSRQILPHLTRDKEQLAAIAKGAHVVFGKEQTPEVILIATGSEVSLAIQAAEELVKQNHAVRVVSMPSCDVFDAQDPSYREQVLPSNVTKRVAIEAAAKDYWYKYVGLQGAVVGLDRYGESAPAKDLFPALGFSVENIIKTVNGLV